MSDVPVARPAPPAAARVLAVWHRVECWVAVACFSFIAIILVLDVLGREFVAPVFNFLGIDVGPTGIFASQRLSIYALVVGSFAGIGIATATGSHLVPRVGFGWVPQGLGADGWTGWPTSSPAASCWASPSTASSSSNRPTRSTCARRCSTGRCGRSSSPSRVGFLSAACRYFAYALWPSLRPGLPEFQE